jgi:uncharacterized protein YndB with AHSA1/START domain
MPADRGRGQVSVAVLVDAPPEVVWAAVTDWDHQDGWVLGTSVRTVGDHRDGLGARLEAVTGVGPVALVDELVVVVWEPPYRCTVRHTGAVVRGTGTFEVFALPAGRSRFVWSEDLELPWGTLGRAGWSVARPMARAGLRASVRRLAARVSAGRAR